MNISRMIITVVVGALLTIATPGNSRANEADEAVLEFLAVSGVADILPQMAQSINQVLEPLLREANPGLNDEEFAVMMSVMNEIYDEEMPKMLLMYVPIYTKYFTVSEIRELTKFYQTPAGQKSVQLLPVLFQEGAVVGQQWAQQNIPVFLDRMKERMGNKGIEVEI